MGDKKRNYKRKTYFIQKMFQTKFVIIFLLLVTIGSILSGAIIYYRTNKELGYSYGRAHIALKETGDILKPSLFFSYGISLLLIGIATVFLTIIISHKVAGPLYRFEKSAGEIGKGNLTVETKIRESDQAKGLAEAFSRMTADLRKKLLEIDSVSLELNKTVSELKQIIDLEKPIISEIKNKCKELDRTSASLRQLLHYFKL